MAPTEDRDRAIDLVQLAPFLLGRRLETAWLGS
jgi:hypothetical protein